MEYGLFASRCCRRCKATAHEDVLVHFEPTQPNPGRNEADVARSTRPKGKKCRLKQKLRIMTLMQGESAFLMNNADQLSRM